MSAWRTGFLCSTTAGSVEPNSAFGGKAGRVRRLAAASSLRVISACKVWKSPKRFSMNRTRPKSSTFKMYLVCAEKPPKLCFVSKPTS